MIISDIEYSLQNNNLNSSFKYQYNNIHHRPGKALKISKHVNNSLMKTKFRGIFSLTMKKRCVATTAGRNNIMQQTNCNL